MWHSRTAISNATYYFFRFYVDFGHGVWSPRTVRGVSHGCEVGCANSIPRRVSSSPGDWMVGRNCLACCVFQIWRHMPVFLRRARQTRRRYLLHRMWVSQRLWWAVFPKPRNVFRWIVRVSPKTTRYLDGRTISSTRDQCNLGEAI